MTVLVWLSSRVMTVGVEVKDGTIVSGAPITRKFWGQPLLNLQRWMARQGGLRGPVVIP